MPSRGLARAARAYVNELARQDAHRSEPHPGRDSLIEYGRTVLPGFKTPPHIVEIAEHLEAVERGDIRRLIIVEPPRHGKSTLVSVLFPAWLLARNPTAGLIHAAYAQSLASQWGWRIRGLLTSAEHRRVFPDSGLAGDLAARHQFATRDGGTYWAVGFEGSVTGRTAGGGRDAHPGALIVDDPYKGQAEAESEVIRENVWNSWTHNLRTRLTMGAGGAPPAIVIIQTRWHEDDLVGRLLAGEGGDRWTLLKHSAIGEDGTPLCEELMPLAELQEMRADVGPRAWQALYQGDPTPDTGTYFERSWLVRGDPPPIAEMRYYGASDYAVSEADGADYTVHLVVGVDTADRMWVVDLYRERAHTGRWVNAAVDLMERWKPDGWAEEKGAILKSVGPWLVKTMQERGVHCVRHPLTSDADKATRARSIQARMSTRGLYIPRHALWSDTLERELLTFPAGRHDDIVDALGLIGRMLLVIRAQSVKAAGRPRRYTVDDMIRDHERRR